MVISMTVVGQVKVGDNPSTINSDAVFEVESADKGVLFPRVALVSLTSSAPMASHARGMVVYNTTTNSMLSPGFYFNSGTSWERMMSSADQEWDYDAANSMIHANRSTNAGRGVFVSDDGRLWIGAVPDASSTSVIRINTSGQTRMGMEVNVLNNSPGFISEVQGGYWQAKYVGPGTCRDLYGGEGLASAESGGGFIYAQIGLRAESRILSGYTGRILTQEGLQVRVRGASTGEASYASGITIDMPCENCTGLNRVGLKIGDVVKSTYETGIPTAYSIHTKAGQVSFGDAMEIRSNTDELRSIQGVISSGLANAPLTLNPFGEEVRIGSTNLEIGTQNTGNRPSFIDFHSANNVNFSARVYRDAGTNGAFIFHQGSGTGGIQFRDGPNLYLSIAPDGTVKQTASTSITIASGTTAERPSNPVEGDMRFNKTTRKFEGFDGSQWVDLNP